MKTTKNVPKLRFPGFEGEWAFSKLSDLLKYEQPTAYIVKSTDYKNEYSTPVLTAGKSFVLGFTDETTGIKEASDDNPVIIFDDFTTSSHYVNFPFKVKSSAMKLLLKNDPTSNIHFINILLKNLDFVPLNHERHWISKYSDFDIKIPKPKEQESIGLFFQNLNSTIEIHQQKIKNLSIKKQALLQLMFPKDGELAPVLRFPGFTNDWEQRKLGSLAEIVRGASPRPIQDPKWFDNSSSVGWLRISDVTSQKGRITFLEQRISELGQAKTRVLKEQHLLLSIAATVGKPLINYVETGVHDGFLIFLSPTFDIEYLFQWLEMFRPNWQKYGQPGSQVNLNSEIIKNHLIMIPKKCEQIKIGSFLNALDNTITLHQRKLEHLELRKKALQQQMFVS